MHPRLVAVLIAAGSFASAVVLVLVTVFTCWTESPCPRGSLLITVAELELLTAVAAVVVAVAGSTRPLRHPVGVTVLALLALFVVGGNAWGYWQESGREHRPVAGWIVGYEPKRVCFVVPPEPVRCADGVISPFDDAVPGDPFTGVMMRERRSDPWDLLVERTGDRVSPAPAPPGRPLPDPAVVRRQHVWVHRTDVPMTAAAPLSAAYVLDWTALPGPPVGAAFLLGAVDGRPVGSASVTLTCPGEPALTLWLGDRPVPSVVRAAETDGWVRLTADVPGDRLNEPLFCGPA